MKLIFLGKKILVLDIQRNFQTLKTRFVDKAYFAIFLPSLTAKVYFYKHFVVLQLQRNIHLHFSSVLHLCSSKKTF